eukprot:gene12939-14269_t
MANVYINDNDANHYSDELPPRPTNLPIRESSSKFGLTQQDVERKKTGSSTLKRKPRVEENHRPELKMKFIDRRELMRQETKLVVLEYLSSLPLQKIPLRKKSQSASAPAPSSNNQVLKAKTIHSSERPFVEVIEREKRRSSKLKRRNSEQHDAKVREKLKSMAVPLKKTLTPEILHDITKFDRDSLKNQTCRRRSPCLALRFSREAKSDSPDTPITSVTTRLEMMGEDIMKDYPQLLDEHLTEILTPLDKGGKLTYDDFAVVAKSVFQKQLARFTGSIWTKLSMVFYLVKEVIFSGALTDTQVEILVEYASRFIEEHSREPIQEEGGWGALKLDGEDFPGEANSRGHVYSLSDEPDPDFVDGHPPYLEEDHAGSRENSTPSPSPPEPHMFGFIKDSVKEWTTYGLAALAVGIGVAYSYMKQQ